MAARCARQPASGRHTRRTPSLRSRSTPAVGTGKAGYAGDGGPATATKLNEPVGVTVDGVGDLYIADFANNAIRFVSPDGTIGTVAGTGRAGFSGDGGPATNAELNTPTRVVIDGQGNLFVADASNNRVRKIAPDDTITTVAGNGHAGYSGDGGPATSAELDFPDDVVVDTAGNLYIVCNPSNVVRMVTPDGTISTVVGTGKAGFKGDGGPATSAELNSPTSIEVDVNGDLLVTDQGNNRVRQITNGVITTIAGNGKPGYTGDGGQGTDAELHTPAGITLDNSGNLYIADRGNDVIRILFNDGTIGTVAGDGSGGYGGDGASALQAQFNSPREVAIAPSGVMYVADCFNNRIRLLLSTPAIASSGVVSASAFGGFSAVAPGSWIEIYVLSLLYNRRRMNEDNPGISVLDLERLMSFPREYLQFTLWYLKSKGYVKAEDNSDYGLTPAGVDYLEDQSARNQLIRELLTGGTRAETAPAKLSAVPATDAAPARAARKSRAARRARRALAYRADPAA